MTMHSKGPWRPSPDGVPYGSIVCDDPSGRNFDERYTAETEIKAYGGYMVAESVAPRNRPLITAAPDLLEALQELMKSLEEWREEEFVILDDEDDLLVRAYAAIAMATGQEVR